MHNALAKQLDNAGLSPDEPPEGDLWAAFLERVDERYARADRTRQRLERALEYSLREMQEQYEQRRERLAAELDQARAILSSLGAALCIIDEAGTILEANPSAERLLGAAPGGLVGSAIEHHVEALGGMDSGISRIPDNGEFGSPHSATMVRVDGTTFPATYTVNPIEVHGRRDSAVVAFFDNS